MLALTAAIFGEFRGFPSQNFGISLLRLGHLTQPFHFPALFFLGQVPLVLADLRVAEQVGLVPNLFRFGSQLDKDGYFGPKHVRNDRLDEEIDGPERIALEDLHLAVRVGREKDNGRRPAPIALADQRRRLEAIHSGHLDVQKNRCEIVI